MFNIALHIILAIVVMVLAYATAIHKLLISKQMSDKLYKNFGFAFIALAVYANCTAVILTAIDSKWMFLALKAGNMSVEETKEMAANVVTGFNSMSIYLIACIAFYGLMLLLVKSISLDIARDYEKPKYRWHSIN